MVSVHVKFHCLNSRELLWTQEKKNLGLQEVVFQVDKPILKVKLFSLWQIPNPKYNWFYFFCISKCLKKPIQLCLIKYLIVDSHKLRSDWNPWDLGIDHFAISSHFHKENLVSLESTNTKQDVIDTVQEKYFVTKPKII